MIRVGPAGWSYSDWEGVVYPRKKPRGFHPLRFLARYVDFLEINSSFYATPRSDYAARWVDLIADRPDFRFAVKLQNVFTHEKLPQEVEVLDQLAHDYLEGIEPLRASGRLSACLVQFPLSFRRSPDAEERLERITDRFGHLPLVLEVRHRSWFGVGGLETIDRLGLSLAWIDLPAAKDHPPQDAPQVGSLAYVRLHGRNRDTWFARNAGRDQRYDYLYGPEEVEEIVKVVRRLSSGVDETFVVTNNHFSGKAVANALEILAGLGHERPLAPQTVMDAFPRLQDVCRLDGEPTLFS